MEQHFEYKLGLEQHFEYNFDYSIKIIFKATLWCFCCFNHCVASAV